MNKEETIEIPLKKATYEELQQIIIEINSKVFMLTKENKQLKEKYNKTLRIFEKTEILPCECFENYFDCTKCDYCNIYCSNADIKFWDNFIENFKGE